MRRRVTKISILQSSKIVTILYIIFGLMYVPIGIAMMIFGPDEMKIVGILYLGMPVLIAVFGFIFFVIGAWLYNVLARYVGGFEFHVEYVDPPPQISSETTSTTLP